MDGNRVQDLTYWIAINYSPSATRQPDYRTRGGLNVEQSVRVKILDHEYLIRSEEEEAQVRQVAEFVDETFREIRDNSQGLSETKTAILAAFHIASEFFQALKDRDVLTLSLGYFFWMVGYYGIVMFLPTISEGLSKTTSLSTHAMGWILGLMYVCAMVTMMLVSNHSDKKNERRFHVVACLVTSGVALIISSYVANTNIVLSFVFLTISLCGAFGAYSPFWAIPPSFLTEAAAAGAIALINSIGNLGGFFGPYIVGYIKDLTGSFNASMTFLGISMFVASFIVAFLLKQSGRAIKKNTVDRLEKTS